jgi:hypothetical protein
MAEQRKMSQCELCRPQNHVSQVHQTKEEGRRRFEEDLVRVASEALLCWELDQKGGLLWQHRDETPTPCIRAQATFYVHEKTDENGSRLVVAVRCNVSGEEDYVETEDEGLKQEMLCAREMSDV